MSLPTNQSVWRTRSVKQYLVLSNEACANFDSNCGLLHRATMCQRFYDKHLPCGHHSKREEDYVYTCGRVGRLTDPSAVDRICQHALSEGNRRIIERDFRCSDECCRILSIQTDHARRVSEPLGAEWMQRLGSGESPCSSSMTDLMNRHDRARQKYMVLSEKHSTTTHICRRRRREVNADIGLRRLKLGYIFSMRPLLRIQARASLRP